MVLFSPEDLKLVKEGPHFRRKFLDTELSQVKPYYHYLLKKYNHILSQRNNLLKELMTGNKSDTTLLEVWDEQLVEIGAKIIQNRIEVIDKLKILARLSHRQITDGLENITLSYESSLSDRIEEKELEEIKIIFRNKLVNNRNEEITRGYTLAGPQRDDLKITMNGIDIRKYGSQGQQRTAALSLKLAELEFMKSEQGEYPVLLLDDVFSELDNKRRHRLIDIMAHRVQTFITATDFF